jgi:hypothetical protein
MALSGSFSGSIRSGNYKLRVDWSATQSVSNNTSKITATMYLVQASSWSLNIASRDDNRTTINGTGYTWESPAISNSGGKTTKLATVTSGNIAHNADGTKSVTITAVFEIGATISGTRYDTITATATITLDTIPRATQPTLSASSADMGAAVTVSMPRASGSFTHDLSYKVDGGSYVSVATGRGTSYSWTVPDVASSIPKATSVKLTLRCITKNGSTTIGTKYAYITAKVPTSVVPPAPTLAIQEATEGLAAQFGAFIQNKSQLAVSVAATGIKGSTITAYQTTVLGKTYTGSSFTTGLLTNAGTVTLSTKVKDSRGRWSAAKTTTVNVLAYSPPKVQALRVYRVDASGAADEEGRYIRVDYKYTVAALNNKNTVQAVVEYKRTTADTWTTLLTNTAYNADTTAKPASPTFPVDYQYDVRLTVTDHFGFATYSAVLPTAEVIMDFLANGKGIALGKVAEQEGFDLGFDIVGSEAVTGAGILPLGGILLQWGNVNITPTAAGVATTEIVTFERPFTGTPTVLATPVSGVPDTLSVGVQRSTTLVGDPKIAVAVTLVRAGTTTTGINWLAIGPG